MVTIRTKEELNCLKDDVNWYENPELLENENSLCFNYYILNIGKCKYDGELDPAKPFLKLMSISHFKRNSVFNSFDQLSRPKLPKKRALNFQEEETSGHQWTHEDNCLIEFINMVYFIEERLPYLSFMKILNKQNIVTQNIQPSPDLLPLLGLNLVSVPLIPGFVAEFNDFQYLDKLSHELWNSLVSFTIRQRQLKDYLNTGITTFVPFLKLPSFGMLSKFIFVIEYTFNHGVLFDNIDTNISSKKIEVYNTALEANSLESFYNGIKLEWISMCRLFSLIKEVKQAFQKYPELGKQIRIKQINFKKLIIKYGPALAYTIQFQWSKETKDYDILLDIDNFNSAKSQVEKPLINYHRLFLSEIRKYFQANQSVVNLVQILNYSCVCSFGLAKLTNMPKFYSKISSQPILSNCGFMLIICSLTHFRLTYYSKYCLDVHIKPNGLVSIRDGSFGLTDINSGIEGLHPIQFLSVFLFCYNCNL